MHIYNKIHVLLSALSYMFRRLLSHLQGELLSYAQNYVTAFDYRSYDTLYIGSKYCLHLFKRPYLVHVRCERIKVLA